MLRILCVLSICTSVTWASIRLGDLKSKGVPESILIGKVLGKLHGSTHVEVLPNFLFNNYSSKYVSHNIMSYTTTFDEYKSSCNAVKALLCTKLPSCVIFAEHAVLDDILQEAPLDNLDSSKLCIGAASANVGYVLAQYIESDLDNMQRFYNSYTESFKASCDAQSILHDTCRLATRWSASASGASIRTSDFIRIEALRDSMAVCALEILRDQTSLDVAPPSPSTALVAGRLLEKYIHGVRVDTIEGFVVLLNTLRKD